jgi:hypothetical protein
VNEPKPLNVFDYEQMARQLLPPATWDYLSAGADDEVTLSRNRTAFEQIVLRPNLLVDVSRIDTSTIILGQRIYGSKATGRRRKGPRARCHPFRLRTASFCAI